MCILVSNHDDNNIKGVLSWKWKCKKVSRKRNQFTDHCITSYEILGGAEVQQLVSLAMQTRNVYGWLIILCTYLRLKKSR